MVFAPPVMLQFRNCSHSHSIFVPSDRCVATFLLLLHIHKFRCSRQVRTTIIQIHADFAFKRVGAGGNVTDDGVYINMLRIVTFSNYSFSLGEMSIETQTHSVQTFFPLICKANLHM